MLVSDILWHNEYARGSKAAVVFRERTYTYAQMSERVRRLANALRHLGIQPREHVAVLATNSSEYIEIIFALSSIGAVWVPLNHRLTPPELSYIVEHSESVALIYTGDMSGNAEAVRAAAPASVRHWVGIGAAQRIGHDYEELIAGATDTRPPAPIADTDLFTLMYTSGTTGRPKGVMLTHRQFLRGTLYLTMAMGFRTDDVVMQVIPQWHAGGQQYQLANLIAGATTVVMPRFDPGLILGSIGTLGVTAVGLVPAMIIVLLETPECAATDFSRLRRIMYGGSPIPEDRLAHAIEVFGAGFQQTYGQTEAGVIVTVLDETDHLIGLRERPEVLRSCGRQILGYDVRVMNDAGAEVQGDARGELVIRSESVMSGYWRNPEATAKTLANGWLHTGDVAHRDDDGRFYIVDRKVDMIVSGGENVYPIEVEHVISSHPDVLEVAVIGVPDGRWGEAVKAIVVARPGTSPTAKTLTAFCRARLGGYKIPKSIDFVPQLPRNTIGKLLKAELRQPFWAGKSRQV